jgi:two-component system cell cycle response regulator
MTARVLVVGGWFHQAKRIEHALTARSFDVAIATNAADCIAAAVARQFDLVLLDASGPGPDAIDLCHRLKAGPEIASLPVLVLSRDGEPALRLRALDAGADECLSAPFTDETLLARIRSLAQMKRLADEVRRLATIRGIDDADLPRREQQARVLVLDGNERSRLRLAELLAPEFAVAVETNPAAALIRAAEGAYDVTAVGLDWASETDGLHLGRQLRLVDRSGSLRVILVADAGDAPTHLIRDHGIDDLLLRPIDRNEALARVRLAARKHLHETVLRQAERIVPMPVPKLSAFTRHQPPERFAA